MHLPLGITKEITDYFEDHLEKHPHDYICVYGSSVYSPEKTTSDVDLFLVTQSPTYLAIGSLVTFIKDLHTSHGRKLDAEVPYENKVHYTDQEVEYAVQFGGFEVHGNRIVVPQIQKIPSFLGSAAMKARLALNGLTTPHTVIGNDFSRYHYSRTRAGESATLLGISLQSEQDFDIHMLSEALTKNQSGKQGELYLGYKTEYPIVQDHLYGTLAGGLDRLEDAHVVERSGDIYHVDWGNFSPYDYMARTALN